MPLQGVDDVNGRRAPIPLKLRLSRVPQNLWRTGSIFMSCVSFCNGSDAGYQWDFSCPRHFALVKYRKNYETGSVSYHLDRDLMNHCIARGRVVVLCF